MYICHVMNRDKKPLWRKENKLALHYRGNTGGEFRHSRYTKGDKKIGSYGAGTSNVW